MIKCFRTKGDDRRVASSGDARIRLIVGWKKNTCSSSSVGRRWRIERLCAWGRPAIVSGRVLRRDLRFVCCLLVLIDSKQAINGQVSPELAERLWQPSTARLSTKVSSGWSGAIIVWKSPFLAGVSLEFEDPKVVALMDPNQT